MEQSKLCKVNPVTDPGGSASRSVALNTEQLQDLDNRPKLWKKVSKFNFSLKLYTKGLLCNSTDKEKNCSKMMIIQIFNKKYSLYYLYDIFKLQPQIKITYNYYIPFIQEK